MADQIPLVAYLRLGEHPRLVAHRCTQCGARFFDRRNGCAGCGGDDFALEDLATTGRLRSFTIVHRSAPNVPTPYISVVVDLDGGGHVKAQLIGIDADPGLLVAGLALRLSTFVADTDDRGSEAVAFAFEVAPEVTA